MERWSSCCRRSVGEVSVILRPCAVGHHYAALEGRDSAGKFDAIVRSERVLSLRCSKCFRDGPLERCPRSQSWTWISKRISFA